MKILRLILLFFTASIYGQHISENEGIFKNNDMLPPEVKKIQEYGDYTLNHTKGMPSITIPVYTINTKTGLNFPISLNYVANGIKVNEIASNVGLGWMLNAFGVITVENNLLYDNGASIKEELFEHNHSPIHNSESHTLAVLTYLERINFGQKKVVKSLFLIIVF